MTQRHMNINEPVFRDAILDTIPCSVFVVDLDGCIIYWNRSAEELTMYHAGEMVGNSCQALRVNICADQCDEVRKTFCPLLSGNDGG